MNMLHHLLGGHLDRLTGLPSYGLPNKGLLRLPGISLLLVANGLRARSIMFDCLLRLMLDYELCINCNGTRSCLLHDFSQPRHQLSL
jgi:hypothetical protein